MGEFFRKIKSNNVAFAIMLGIVVLACLIGLTFGMYRFFYERNSKTVQTLAENNKQSKEEKIEEIPLDSDAYQDENFEDEEENNEEEEKEEKEEEEDKEEEELTEEEKQKREEERKKQEEERKKKEEEQRKLASQGYPYWIKVNYSANTVTVYGKDENGDYTVPVKAMVCSTGSSTPRSGVYRTPNKARWGVLIGPVWGQYCTRITGQILFHSVPYLKKEDPSSLEYWEYDRLGTQRSMGCIRLTVADAQWIYYNCPIGTSVEFYSSADPGPLGKPGIKAVSGYPDYLRGWDPTDPDPNNPWNNQLAQEDAERKAQEEAARQEAERQENERKVAEEEAIRKAEEEARKKAEEEARKKDEEEARKKDEEVARKKAEEEAARKAAEEAAKQEAERANRRTVPNVVGETANEAREILKQQGLLLDENLKYSTDSSKPNGVIISQVPEAGTQVDIRENNKVKIVINLLSTNTNQTDGNN